MNNLHIRPATIDDTKAIYNFMCTLTEKELDYEMMQQCIAINIGKEHYHHLIAELDGRPVGFITCYGFISLHHCGMEYEIQELIVDEQYRSMKIGKQLLDAIIQQIGEYKSLKLCSNMRRKDAHRFYINYGFEQTGFRFIK
jgi:PhnO protein